MEGEMWYILMIVLVASIWIVLKTTKIKPCTPSSEYDSNTTLRDDPNLRRIFNNLSTMDQQIDVFRVGTDDDSEFWAAFSKLFVVQGKYLVNVTDNYPEVVPLQDNRRKMFYKLLNFEQFRTYITWRTQFQNGTCNNAIGLGYVWLYVTELINLIGVDTPDQALEQLLWLWFDFRKVTNEIKVFDKYMESVLEDFYIYYCFEVDYDTFCKRYPQCSFKTKYFGIIPQWETMRKQDKLSYLVSSSDYPIEKSTTFKSTYSSLYKKAVVESLENIDKYLAENRINILESETKWQSQPWRPFNKFHFDYSYKDKHHTPYEVITYGGVKYELGYWGDVSFYYRDGRMSWRVSYYSTRFHFSEYCHKKFYGYISKYVDLLLRQLLHFGRTITVNREQLLKTLNAADEHKIKDILFKENKLENLIMDSVNSIVKKEKL